MIRKQLYITKAQNRALKEAARARGVSEAELTREALDDYFSEDDADLPSRPGALNTLIQRTRRLSSTHRLPSGFRFERNDLYEDRGLGSPPRSRKNES